MAITMDVFQDSCCETAIYRNNLKSKMERLCYTVLGLASEAGEVSGKLKKVMRDHNGYVNEDRARAMMAEVGDVLWYCAMICDELSFSMEECAELVLFKLRDRQERGVLGGSGDNR